MYAPGGPRALNVIPGGTTFPPRAATTAGGAQSLVWPWAVTRRTLRGARRIRGAPTDQRVVFIRPNFGYGSSGPGGGGPERLVLRSPEGEVGSGGSEVGRVARIRKTNPTNPGRTPRHVNWDLKAVFEDFADELTTGYFRNRRAGYTIVSLRAERSPGSLDIGRYLLKTFFGDDPEKARSQNPAKNASIRKLTEDPNLLVGATTIFNAIRVAIDDRVLEDVPEYQALTESHKVALVRVKNLDAKAALAREAHAAKWSVRKLQQHARGHIEEERKKITAQGRSSRLSSGPGAQRRASTHRQCLPSLLRTRSAATGPGNADLTTYSNPMSSPSDAAPLPGEPSSKRKLPSKMGLPGTLPPMVSHSGSSTML